MSRTRSCSFQIHVEHRLANSLSLTRTVLATGGARCPLNGGPINANATRRCARNKIRACVGATMHGRTQPTLPDICIKQEVTMAMNLSAGETFLDHIAEVMYEHYGSPAQGVILGWVFLFISGNTGCGFNGNRSFTEQIGTVTVDIGQRTISSPPHVVEFKLAPQSAGGPPEDDLPDPEPLTPIFPGHGIGGLTTRPDQQKITF